MRAVAHGICILEFCPFAKLMFKFLRAGTPLYALDLLDRDPTWRGPETCLPPCFISEGKKYLLIIVLNANTCRVNTYLFPQYSRVQLPYLFI